MASPAPQLPSAHELLALAEQASGAAERARLYVAVAGLFETTGADLGENERALIREILAFLTRSVEMSVRQALAERLADSPGAPHDLILMLANDRIEIATPVLQRSQALDDAMLVALVREMGDPHRQVIAGRPGIGAEVCEAIVEEAGENVVLRLLENQTATLTEPVFVKIIDRADGHPALHEPLARRHDLPATCAERLYALVGDALREYLVREFDLDEAKVQADINAAREAAQANKGTIVFSDDRAAARLVEKLHKAGELKTSFLLKAINSRQMPLFWHGLARLAEIDADTARRVSLELGPVPLALACRALKIDRAVFVSVNKACAAEGGRTGEINDKDGGRIDTIFQDMSAEQAMTCLKDFQ